jgi:hypothetical protein
MIGYLCVLYVGDGVKRRLRPISPGLEKNTVESRRN